MEWGYLIAGVIICGGKSNDYKTILDENGSSQRYKETISPSEGRKNR